MENPQTDITSDILLRDGVSELLTNPVFIQTESLVKEWREGVNPWYTIDDLPLTDSQRLIVLEYLAWQLSKLRELVNGDDQCGKTYDPLVIDDNNKVAHSYAFDLWDGGRHHPFETLKQIEEGMLQEIASEIKSND